MTKPLLSIVLSCLFSGILIAQNPFSQLSYRHIGPDGNRAIAALSEPNNPLVMYIGAASGGIFKTDDGGATWRPIFDKYDVSSVGSLAMAPTDTKQIWAGTGETFVIRPAHSVGNGIYKSNDGGKTWKNMGLEKTGRIGRIVIHPKNPDIVYACAMGHLYGPQQERGIYRTQDGGKTWEQILFVDQNTGANELAINLQNPDIMFAAMWQVSVNTWGLNSGGTSGGVYRTKDGGKTWEPLSEKIFGQKNVAVGKTSIAVAPNNPNVVYALFEMKSPALYRSDDGGESWKLMSNDHSLAERAPYYTRLAVASDSANEVHTIGVKHGISKDGGKTWDFGYKGGGDNHDLWINPVNANHQIMSHDGCASVTYNRWKTSNGIVLPIAQMYHVSVDNQIPYNVYGNRQDGYSYRGPSNNLAGRNIPLSAWESVGGCESGFAKPDPFDNNIIWSGCYDGGLDVYDLRTKHARDVRVWPEAGYGWKPADLKIRWHWNFPLSFSPHTPHRVYVGSQYIHKSDDFGQSWQTISPDLTLNDKSHQQNSGGIATDNLMTFDGSLIFAVEESPIQKDLIWVGTNDGQVQVTKDGGKTWTNVSANLTVPKWGTIANIEPSKYDAATAYISVDLHQMGDFDPYILKTTDFGQSWTKISDGIPKSMLSFVHVIKEDPKQKGMLYAGTDNNLYFSANDGKTWTSLRLNMPPAPVYWLEIQKEFDDLVVATYGRGFWILDDISAVRNAALNTENKAAQLFPVRKVYRFHEKEVVHNESTLSDGQNPPQGAVFNYFLKDTLKKKPTISILKDGKLVRKLNASNKKGVNRLVWALRHESPERPKLRTNPPNAPWVSYGKDSTRDIVIWDLDMMMGQIGPKTVPGKYTVQLEADGQTESQEFEILKDPYTTGTQADIEQQVAFSLQIREAMNQTVKLINTLEINRKKAQDLLPKLPANKSKEKLYKTAVENYLQVATTVSSQLVDINLTGAREDAFRNPVQIYERLAALGSDIGANGSDFKPTNQQREVFGILSEKLNKLQAEFDSLELQYKALKL